MKTNTSLAIAALIILMTGYFVLHKGGDTGTTISNSNAINNQIVAKEDVVMKDGVQYIAITAHGGYFPKVSSAKAGIPTKLVIKTNGTYDCSAALVIHSLNYRKMLPNTGETIIDAGTYKIGDTLQGVCGMGMYSFVVNFQ